MAHQLSKHSPLKDDRIFDREAHIEILFDGSITLWRSAANLDVVLAYFADFHCLELIVFHPVKNLEAPRLYIDCGILEQHLSLADMQARIKERVDMFTRHHQVVVQENIEKDVKLSTFSNYVVSRIVLKECEGFEVELQARFGDEVVEDTETHLTHLDFVVSPPVNLIPLHTEHLAKPDVGDFLKKLSTFSEDRTSAESHYANANRLLHNVELVITAFRSHNLNYASSQWSLACRRWKRAINHVLNMVVSTKLRKLLQERAYSALQRKVITDEPSENDSSHYRKPLGPLNEAEFSHLVKQRKFINHLPKSKEARSEESLRARRVDIHILQKSCESQGQSANHRPLHRQRSFSDPDSLTTTPPQRSDEAATLVLTSAKSSHKRTLSDETHMLPSIGKQPSMHNTAFTFGHDINLSVNTHLRDTAPKMDKFHVISTPKNQKTGFTHIFPSVNT